MDKKYANLLLKATRKFTILSLNNFQGQEIAFSNE